ncbi:hypothetical protein GYMLUDRAFT_48963 [Collybiopsis luxurians FD-317 M1]|uniref:Uncharacterized protein n=1 Tax=Collybiopsis luxurians FD-317 M1 TaxID=944289 RepID=A0A0D0CGT6_9AGAR|nr:hypothetical protein GYMLUDRAFT_48963 [Collybiopsis luxurians FD-317 M1]
MRKFIDDVVVDERSNTIFIFFLLSYGGHRTVGLIAYSPLYFKRPNCGFLSDNRH